MAVPACLRLADSVFPRVRPHAAQRLATQGWSQARIAEALGVSQAMVSKYRSRPLPAADALVLRLVDELVSSLHDPAEGPEGTSPWCTTLTQRGSRPGMDEALDDLLLAEARLIDRSPRHVMPEVGINLARALPAARGPRDVLAYPARIVGGTDRFLRPQPPTLGASNHLAGILLALRRQDPQLQALANIRGGQAIADAARPFMTIEGDGPRAELIEGALATTPGTPAWSIHDPGAIGIEPCLYVAGRTAADVVAHILDIARSTAPTEPVTP